MLPAPSSSSEICTTVGPQTRCGCQPYAPATGSGSCSDATSTHHLVLQSQRRVSGRSEALRRRPDHALRAAFARRLRDEALQLIHAGIDVHLFEPDAAGLNALGINPIDRSRTVRVVPHAFHRHRQPDRPRTHRGPTRHRPIHPTSGSDAARVPLPQPRLHNDPSSSSHPRRAGPRRPATEFAGGCEGEAGSRSRRATGRPTVSCVRAH